MDFKKMKVSLETGCTFVFIKKGNYTGVRGYDKDGKMMFPIREVLKLNEPQVGGKLSFSYDAEIDTDYFETSTRIVSIEKN